MASYHLLNTPAMSSVGEPNRLAMLKSFCRLCLEETEDFTSIHYTGNKFNTPPSIMIKCLMPELYTGVSLNPVICYHCLEDLYSCYEFRLKCLKTENIIGIYLTETKNDSTCVRLNDVVRYWKNKEKQNEFDQNELLRQSAEDDCILLNDDVNLQTKPAKVVEENKKPISEPIKITPEKVQIKPMLKAIDISKLMDPNKKSMFGMEMSSENRDFSSVLNQSIPKSLLKSSISTKDNQDLNAAHNLESFNSSQSNEFTIKASTSSAGGTAVVKKSEKIKQPKIPDLSLIQDGTQTKEVMLVMCGAKYPKIAPKLSTTTHQTLRNTEVPKNLQKLRESSEKVVAGGGVANKTESYSTLKNMLDNSEPNRTNPVILNTSFQPGESAPKSAPTGINVLRLRPDSELKKLSSVRTLNHELLLRNDNLARIDYEHESLPASIIYKPNILKRTTQEYHGKRRPVQGIKTINLNPAAQKELGNNSVQQAFTETRNQLISEDQIDIKDEPLSLAQTPFDVVDSLLDKQVDAELGHLKSLFPGEFSVAAGSGESTRSASEISFMDIAPAHDDTDDEFCEDQPDYVQVHRTGQNLSSTNTGKTVTALSLNRPMPTKTLQNQITGKKRTRIRKRLKLVPVEAAEVQTIKQKKLSEKTETSAVVRKHVTPGRYPEPKDKVDSSIVNKNIVVLYTNFTAEGDYINDHDYLVSPYVRNKIYYRTNNGLWLCCCLICDLLQTAEDHISHMSNHSTTCNICNVDFENVFILNLHVKCHVKKCEACCQTISYPMHATHGKICKGTVEDSNEMSISKLRTCLNTQPKLYQRPSSSHQEIILENYSNPFLVSQEGLMETITPLNLLTEAENLNQIPERKRYKSPTPEEDEEEACIYDKESKRFITPTMMKQKRRNRIHILEEDDEIPLIQLVHNLKEKEALETKEKHFVEDIVKTYSDLQLGIPEEFWNTDNEQTIENLTLTDLLQNQPFVFLSKIDEEMKIKDKNNSEVFLFDIPCNLTDEGHPTLENNPVNVKVEKGIKSSRRRHTRSRASKNKDMYLTSKNNDDSLIVDSQADGSAVRLITEMDNGSLTIDLVNESEIDRTLTNDNDGALTGVVQDARGGEEFTLSKFGGTNTSQIEETHNETESEVNISKEASMIKEAATEEESTTEEVASTDIQAAELVENPFSTRRSVRLRTRNEFTPGVLAASLDWRATKKKSKLSESTDNTPNLVEEGQSVTETEFEENQGAEEPPENVAATLEDSQNLSDTCQNNSKSLKITILQNRLRKKLKKTKRARILPEDPQVTTDLKKLEVEIQRIKEEMRKLKETPPKKKKIKKIPKELKDRMIEYKNLKSSDTESNLLESLSAAVLQQFKVLENKNNVVEKSSQETVEVNVLNTSSTLDDIISANESLEYVKLTSENHNEIEKTADKNPSNISDLKYNQINKNLDVLCGNPSNLPESFINTATLLTEPLNIEINLENESENVGEQSSACQTFEKLRGETMEELFKRLEQTACVASPQPRTRKRPRISEGFVTNTARKRIKTKDKNSTISNILTEEQQMSKNSGEIGLELEDTVFKNPEQIISSTDTLNMEGMGEEIGQEFKEKAMKNSEPSVYPDSMVVTPNLVKEIVKSEKIVKKVKRRPKEMIGYRRGRKLGFGWAKRNSKKAPISKKVKKCEGGIQQVINDTTEKPPEIPSSAGETVQDPYSFDTELLEEAQAPLGFRMGKKTPQVSTLDQDTNTKIKRKPEKSIERNLLLNKNPSKRPKLKRNPAQMIKKEALPFEESVLTPEENSTTLQSILETMILQVPDTSSPKPKTSEDKSKVLKKNPLNIKNRVKKRTRKVEKIENKAVEGEKTNQADGVAASSILEVKTQESIKEVILENNPISLVKNPCITKRKITLTKKFLDSNVLGSKSKRSRKRTKVRIENNTTEPEITVELSETSHITVNESIKPNITSTTQIESSKLPEEDAYNENIVELVPTELQKIVELSKTIIPSTISENSKDTPTSPEKQVENETSMQLISTEPQKIVEVSESFNTSVNESKGLRNMSETLKEVSTLPKKENENKNNTELCPTDSQPTIELLETSVVKVTETRRSKRISKNPKETPKLPENNVKHETSTELVTIEPQELPETSTTQLKQSIKPKRLSKTPKEAPTLPEEESKEEVDSENTITESLKAVELSETSKKVVRKLRTSKRKSRKLSEASTLPIEFSKTEDMPVDILETLAAKDSASICENKCTCVMCDVPKNTIDNTSIDKNEIPNSELELPSLEDLIHTIIQPVKKKKKKPIALKVRPEKQKLKINKLQIRRRKQKRGNPNLEGQTIKHCQEAEQIIKENSEVTNHEDPHEMSEVNKLEPQKCEETSAQPSQILEKTQETIKKRRSRAKTQESNRKEEPAIEDNLELVKNQDPHEIPKINELQPQKCEETNPQPSQVLEEAKKTEKKKRLRTRTQRISPKQVRKKVRVKGDATVMSKDMFSDCAKPEDNPKLFEDKNAAKMEVAPQTLEDKQPCGPEKLVESEKLDEVPGSSEKNTESSQEIS